MKLKIKKRHIELNLSKDKSILIGLNNHIASTGIGVNWLIMDTFGHISIDLLLLNITYMF